MPVKNFLFQESGYKPALRFQELKKMKNIFFRALNIRRNEVLRNSLECSEKATKVKGNSPDVMRV